MRSKRPSDATAKERMRRYRARLNEMAKALGGFETVRRLNRAMLLAYDSGHISSFLKYMESHLQGHQELLKEKKW